MSQNLEHIIADIVEAAQYVAANALPGWREANYEAALVAEICAAHGPHLAVQQQVTLRSYFKTSTGLEVETGAFRPDLRVECRCLDCSDLSNSNNWEQHCYVEIKLEPKGAIQTAHKEQARGYAAAASGWAKQEIACLAVAFTGRGSVLCEAYAGENARSLAALLP